MQVHNVCDWCFRQLKADEMAVEEVLKASRIIVRYHVGCYRQHNVEMRRQHVGHRV